MKKRVLSILIVLCMVFALLPASAFAASNESSTITILTQPNDVTVDSGDDAVFTISAVNTGSLPLRYLWYDVNSSAIDSTKLTALKAASTYTYSDLDNVFGSAKLGEGNTLTLTKVQENMQVCCVVYYVKQIISVNVAADMVFSNEVSLTVVPLCAEHVYGENLKKVDALDATCAHEGNIEYYKCEDCGRCYADEDATTQVTSSYYTIAKNASNHANLVHHEAVEATCTECKDHHTGNTEYWECTVCGKLYSDEALTTETTLEEVTTAEKPHYIGILNNVITNCEVSVTKYDNSGHWTACKYCGYVYADTYSTHTLISTTATCCSGTKHCLLCEYDSGDYDKTKHTGGTATCLKRAVCTECGEEYGEFAHKYGDWTVTSAPTCTEKGVETRYCSQCSAYETREIAATGHDFGEWAVTTAPTCITSGIETRYCSRCDAYETRTVAALGHSYKDKVVEPTCTTKGYTIHTCDKCSYSYVDNYIDAFGHSYGEWIVTTAPTCITSGIETRYCNRCDAYETRTVDALGHSYKDEVVKPTCTAKGYTIHSCTECSYSYVDNYVDALGHNYGEWIITTAPTCITSGIETRYCSRCDAYETRTVDALGHNYKDIVVKPTCTVKGYTIHTCTECSNSYVDNYVDALGHNYGEWVVTSAPTCTASGSMIRYCSRCDAYETKSIPALGHDCVHHDGKDATCTEAGWEAYDTCARCTYTTYKEIPALGHTYTEVVTAPTCTEQGYTTHTCACGASYVDNYTDATGHSYTATVTAATTKAMGYTTYTCSECGDSYKADYTLAAPTISIARSSGKPKISWSAIGGATKYIVYYSTNGKSYSKLITTTKLTVTNTKAASGKTYYYKVKAVGVVNDETIYSAYSNVKSMVTTLTAPTLSKTTSNGHPKISWKAVTGADKYIVYYSTNGKSYSKLITTTKLSVTHTKAKSGKTYYYKVKAVSNQSSNATSAYSKAVSIKAK